MDVAYLMVARSILELRENTFRDRQIFVGIAGPPGCGKSTIAQSVKNLLQEKTPQENIVIIPMDGFHLTRRQLAQGDDPVSAFARRGAPWTFDVEGLLRFMSALRDSADIRPESRKAMLAPSFDHAHKDPVPDSILISPTTSIILLEGNYLLLDQPRWKNIAPSLDLRIMVEVENSLASKRVAERHVLAGLEPSMDRALKRFENNDALNGEIVRNSVLPFDVKIGSLDDPIA